MGLPGGQQMKIIKIDVIEDETFSSYPDIFTGLSCIEEVYTIKDKLCCSPSRKSFMLRGMEKLEWKMRVSKRK